MLRMKIVIIMHKIATTKLNFPNPVFIGGNVKLKFMKKVKLTNYPIKNVNVNPHINIFLKKALNNLKYLYFFRGRLDFSKIIMTMIIIIEIIVLP